MNANKNMAKTQMGKKSFVSSLVLSLFVVAFLTSFVTPTFDIHTPLITQKEQFKSNKERFSQAYSFSDTDDLPLLDEIEGDDLFDLSSCNETLFIRDTFENNNSLRLPANEIIAVKQTPLYILFCSLKIHLS